MRGRGLFVGALVATALLGAARAGAQQEPAKGGAAPAGSAARGVARADAAPAASSAALAATAPALAASATATTAPPSAGAAASATAGGAAPATSAAPASPAVTYSLRQCLDLADLRHPNIQGARSRVDVMRAQLDEARTAPFSGFTLTAGAGPAPTFRGGQIYTQDREVGLNSNLGMAWQANFNGTVPLWTFGKITNLWRAAEAQIQVGEGEAQKTRNAVKLDVRRAYYGLLLAREALSLLGEAAGQLDKVLKPLQKKVAEGEGDEIDLLRLMTSRAELDARLAEAKRGEQVALGALRFYTGVEGAFDIPAEGLKLPKRELGPLTDYQDAARQHRPELRMARAGLAAREAQVDLARSKLLPDIGLTLSASYSRAPEITDQLNPFVRDDANYLRYGFALGMRWSLDIAPGVARVRQAEAQLDEMHHTMRYASGGTALEVEKAHAEAIETRKKVEAYKPGRKSARQWMIKVVQGIDVGVFEERDLVDPARQYALQRYSYLSALMDHNIAVANLALVTGYDPIADTAD